MGMCAKIEILTIQPVAMSGFSAEEHDTQPAGLTFSHQSSAGRLLLFVEESAFSAVVCCFVPGSIYHLLRGFRVCGRHRDRLSASNGPKP
jgi:hypothetical protein